MPESNSVSPDSPVPPPVRRRRNRRFAVILGLLLIGYVAIAYVLMPTFWDLYFRDHPSLDDVPGITTTTTGIPGDPVNVALTGTKQDVERIMHAAKWFPANPLGLKSDIKIAADTVLDRPYEEAPVSSLYLYGRKEDLAFEKPVGDNPQQRNHVRFWKSDKVNSDGRPIWMGAASYDKGVGLSHTTGEVTHHIGEDVDTERDRLFHDLELTGDLSETYIEKGFHKQLTGKNGGGDPWKTDGDLWVGVIKPDAAPVAQK